MAENLIDTSLISIIISGIALVVSVVSPVLTAAINNHHETKMYKLRFHDEHKAIVIENYLQAAGRCISAKDDIAFQNYGEAYGEIFFYAPESLWNKITSLDLYIRNCEYDIASGIFNKLLKDFAQESPRRKSKWFVKQNRNQ